MSFDALYAAVLAAPADDTPRLVLADWLDESGDPDRAEFIRAQCEAESLHPNSRWRHVLEARAGELFAAHWIEWWRPVCERLGLPPPARPWASAFGWMAERLGLAKAGWPYVESGTKIDRLHFSAAETRDGRFAAAKFVRGFPDHLRLAPGPTGPTLADWAMAVPVTSLAVSALAHEVWGELYDGPALAQVRSIELESFGPEHILPVVHSPHLTGLRELTLDTEAEGVSAAELAAVAGAPAARQLRSLAVSIQDEEAAAELAGAVVLSGLTALDLDFGFLEHGHGTSDETFAAGALAARVLDRLARSPHLVGLEKLSLGGLVVTADLALAFPRLDDLTLDLRHLADPTVLLDWPGLTRLRHLRLALADAVDKSFLAALADRLDSDRVETVRLETGPGAIDGALAFLTRFEDRVWLA
jgi:uncharacterized protein (TIGR02996 family)